MKGQKKWNEDVSQTGLNRSYVCLSKVSAFCKVQI